MYLAVLSRSIFAHAVLITTNYPASAHTYTHTAVPSGLSADIVSVLLGCKTCWATFPDTRNLCAGNKRREIFSLPPRFARDRHASSQLIKLRISVTPSSLTLHLIIQSILNKIHIHFCNITLHVAHCCMLRPRLLMITYLTRV